MQVTSYRRRQVVAQPDQTIAYLLDTIELRFDRIVSEKRAMRSATDDYGMYEQTDFVHQPRPQQDADQRPAAVHTYGVYAEAVAQLLKRSLDVDVVHTTNEHLHMLPAQVLQVFSWRLMRDKRNAIAPVPRAAHGLPGAHAAATIRHEQQRPGIPRLNIVGCATRCLVDGLILRSAQDRTRAH